jgi:RNA-directed DNA polymerase
LSNVALSVLDEHIAQAPGGPGSNRYDRGKRRRGGLPNFRLVRYADDWCLMVHGTQADAAALEEEIAGVLATMGLRLSRAKTLITHIEEGLDFLGWRIQRHRKKGANRYYVYTYPAKKALRAIMTKVKTLCRQVGSNEPLDTLLRRLNPTLRGWCAYFRPGCSARTFAYLSHYVWHRVWRWLQRKHPKTGAWQLQRRYYRAGSWPVSEYRKLYNPAKVGTTRYHYRGAAIPTPWPDADARDLTASTVPVESPVH